MKDNIFISHSSVWKTEVVEPLVKLLGQDLVVVDKYNFESGEEIWSEIRKSIEDCRYFLYLISKEALIPGGWVEREIGFVRELVDEGKTLFWPIIIDPDVEWNDSRIKTWIKNVYITDHYSTVSLLAHLIECKVRRDIYSRDEKLRLRRSLFMGRDDELSILKGKLSDCRTDSERPNPNTLIISGLGHLGRKSFLKEFLSREVKTNTLPEDIFTISLDASDDEWAFLQKLNEIVGKYQPYEITEIYNRHDQILPLIKELYSTIRDNKSTVVVNDDGAIVKRDGHIAGWFVGLFKIKDFEGDMMFNVVSRFKPRHNVQDKFPTVIPFTLREIKKDWLVRLFKEYALSCGVPVSDSLTDECVNEAKGYPLPVYKAVEALAGGGNRSHVKKAMNEAKDIIEQNFKTIIDGINDNTSSAIHLLSILSRVPLMCERDLELLMGDELYECLDRLDSNGLLLFSGRDNSLVSANPGITSYIRNQRFKLPEDMEKRYHTLVSDKINNFRTEGIGIAGYMLAARERIRHNPLQIPDDLLIPSLVLRLMIEYYYQGDNNLVVAMADQLLNGYAYLTAEIERSVRYWLCSALSREGTPRAEKEIAYFDEESYSYNFLMGFYHRHKKGNRDRQYIFARDYYMAAYNKTFVNNDSEFDDAKLLHELWIVKFTLGDPDALDFAKECYNRRPANYYHIEAYFRSLVRSKGADIGVLKQLIDDMRRSDDPHKLIIAKTMDAEMKYFATSRMDDFVKSIQCIVECDCKSGYANYPLRVLYEVCRKNDALQIYDSVRNKYSKLGDDVDYPHMPD